MGFVLVFWCRRSGALSEGGCRASAAALTACNAVYATDYHIICIVLYVLFILYRIIDIRTEEGLQEVPWEGRRPTAGSPGKCVTAKNTNGNLTYCDTTSAHSCN